MNDREIERLIALRDIARAARAEVDALEVSIEKALQRAHGQHSFAELCEAVEGYARKHESFTVADLRSQIGVVVGSTLNSAIFKLKKKKKIEKVGGGRYRSLVFE